MGSNDINSLSHTKESKFLCNVQNLQPTPARKKTHALAARLHRFHSARTFTAGSESPLGLLWNTITRTAIFILGNSEPH
jgi:hypothetical protein